MTHFVSKMRNGLLVFLASSSLSVASDCCYTSSVDCCDDPCGCLPVRVEADYLLWQLRTPYDHSSVITEVSTDVTKEKYYGDDYDYKSGFRLGVYYDGLFSCLDVGVIWTTYYTSFHDSIDIDSNQNFRIDSDVDELSIKKQVNFNYVDLDFSSRFCPTCCLSLRPHIGLRALWLNFNSRAEFSGDIGTTTDTLHINRHYRDEDSGIGLQGGLWAEWQLGCGFSLVGHFGGSVLLYEDQYRFKLNAVTKDSSGNELTNVLEEECETIKSSQQTFDYFLGVKYNTRLCNNDVYVQVGWEHIFLNFEYYQFQGLTVGLGTSF